MIVNHRRIEVDFIVSRRETKNRLTNQNKSALLKRLTSFIRFSSVHRQEEEEEEEKRRTNNKIKHTHT